MGISLTKSKSSFIQDPLPVPVQPKLKKPKIIRRIPNQPIVIHNKPYLNTFQVLTGLSGLAFFVGTYYWIK